MYPPAASNYSLNDARTEVGAFQQTKLFLLEGGILVTATRKAIAGFALAGALAIPGLALATPSFADSKGYCTQPGCEQLRTDGAPGNLAQNGTYGPYNSAGSGAFGIYVPPGTDLSTCGECKYPPRGGTDGYQTGLNNSNVAGNRPGDSTPPDTPRSHPAPQNG